MEIRLVSRSDYAVFSFSRCFSRVVRRRAEKNPGKINEKPQQNTGRLINARRIPREPNLNLKHSAKTILSPHTVPPRTRVPDIVERRARPDLFYAFVQFVMKRLLLFY